MRKRMLLAAAAVLLSAPAAQAQTGAETGVRTETMERMSAARDRNLPYNIIGLLGLLGLLGLRRGHSEDSYHPTPME